VPPLGSTPGKPPQEDSTPRFFHLCTECGWRGWWDGAALGGNNARGPPAGICQERPDGRYWRRLYCQCDCTVRCDVEVLAETGTPLGLVPLGTAPCRPAISKLPSLARFPPPWTCGRAPISDSTSKRPSLSRASTNNFPVRGRPRRRPAQHGPHDQWPQGSRGLNGRRRIRHQAPTRPPRQREDQD
jgi:hypothetical protein